MVALMAAGTILSAYGSVSAGQSRRRAARAEARERERAAAVIRAYAAFNERRQREADARAIGAQRTAIAKSGVELVGSPLDAYAASVRNADLTARAILFEGEIQARAQEAQARLVRMEGEAAFRAGTIGAGTSILGSFGSFAGGGGSSGGTPVRGQFSGEWAWRN